MFVLCFILLHPFGYLSPYLSVSPFQLSLTLIFYFLRVQLVFSHLQSHHFILSLLFSNIFAHHHTWRRAEPETSYYQFFFFKFTYFALGSLFFLDYCKLICNQCYTELLNVFLTRVYYHIVPNALSKLGTYTFVNRIRTKFLRQFDTNNHLNRMYCFAWHSCFEKWQHHQILFCFSDVKGICSENNSMTVYGIEKIAFKRKQKSKNIFSLLLPWWATIILSCWKEFWWSLNRKTEDRLLFDEIKNS